MSQDQEKSSEERVINPFLKRTSYLGDYQPEDSLITDVLFGGKKVDLPAGVKQALKKIEGE